MDETETMRQERSYAVSQSGPVVNELREQLAAIEHTRWADWQRYMHSKCERNSDGTLTIPKWAVDNWERQIDTHYDQLSNQEKESDREQVDRYWHLVKP